MYRKFDVIKIEKMHTNYFLKMVNNLNNEKIIITKSNINLYAKIRPAIIIRVFKQKSGNDKYLVIPLTTKRSIKYWSGAEEALRVRIEHEKLKNGVSYLMLDSMLSLNQNEIIGFYKIQKSFITFTGSQKKWIIKNVTSKLQNLLTYE